MIRVDRIVEKVRELLRHPRVVKGRGPSALLRLDQNELPGSPGEIVAIPELGVLGKPMGS